MTICCTAWQVGVVSDFDLLALDSLGRTNDSALFPKADQTWQVGCRYVCSAVQQTESRCMWACVLYVQSFTLHLRRVQGNAGN